MRELATAWGPPLPAGAPCTVGPAQGLACWRHRSGNLPLLAQLDRPVVLGLVDDGGRSGFARLLALGPQGAVVGAGTRRWRLQADQLAALWRGELHTWWRLPPESARRRMARWRLCCRRQRPSGGSATGAGPAPPASRHRRLTPPPTMPRCASAWRPPAVGRVDDGLAGPAAYMLLNRALAVDEPRAWPGSDTVSYILDALRRADAERQRGGVPGLHDQTGPLD